MGWNARWGRVARLRVQAEGHKVGFAIQVLHSRQQKPLFQDDALTRGDFAPRSLINRVIGSSGDLVIGNPKS
jgi:hypothetical protein